MSICQQIKVKEEINKQQFGSKTASKSLLALLYHSKIVLANIHFFAH
jgi:hypothetical protein